MEKPRHRKVRVLAQGDILVRLSQNFNQGRLAFDHNTILAAHSRNNN